jgi:hypothetical protein
VEWEFQSSLIFSRLDRFIDQLRLIEVFRKISSYSSIVDLQCSNCPTVTYTIR